MSSIIKVDTVQDQDGNNIINENANTITIGASGDTITIPSGATLANNGTATGFASIAWQSSIVTAATHTAAAGQGLWLDTSSNAITLTLPSSPSVGDQIIFTDYARNWATNAITLSLNGSKFQGSTSPAPVYNTNGQSVDIVFSGTTKGWIPNSDDDVTLETPQIYLAEYFLVAGGASGGFADSAGGNTGGGGGAGGVLTNYGGTKITLSKTSVYTATVGAGGVEIQGAPGGAGNDGGNSVLSGFGITTVTALGGGGGGGQNALPGRDGGSGGGAARGGGVSGYGNGTAPQGNRGGAITVAGPYYPGAGGGGKGAVGQDTQSGGGGNGGNGEANSITGSAVTYAGGGGSGIAVNGGTPGSGGTGGGGAGGAYNSTAVSGTANTGGGGGGGGSSSAYSGNGGTGVLILRVPTAEYSSTVTGSPTVTTDGSDTIIKFTGSGSYTG
jgi:hypothetical protein